MTARISLILEKARGHSLRLRAIALALRRLMLRAIALALRRARLQLNQFAVQKRLCVRARVGRHDVTVADKLVFINQKAFDSDRAAGMRFICTDTDLGAKTIAESIGEAS